jgi:hypothetical protein
MRHVRQLRERLIGDRSKKVSESSEKRLVRRYRLQCVTLTLHSAYRAMRCVKRRTPRARDTNNEVIPLSFFLFTSAPAPTSSFTTSSWPALTKIKGINQRHTEQGQLRIPAMCRAVHPPSSVLSTSAPFSSKYVTMSRWPADAAQCSGVRLSCVCQCCHKMPQAERIKHPRHQQR